MENLAQSPQKRKENIGKFPGFPTSPKTNYFRFPKALNGWVDKLTGGELKVLWYIIRHTWGYNKTSDTISYDQFMDGIVKKDGTLIDVGTGLSKSSVKRSIKSLEEKGFIEVKRNHRKISVYKLKIVDNRKPWGSK